jgi:hypothetical protein
LRSVWISLAINQPTAATAIGPSINQDSIYTFFFDTSLTTNRAILRGMPLSKTQPVTKDTPAASHVVIVSSIIYFFQHSVLHRHIGYIVPDTLLRQHF